MITVDEVVIRNNLQTGDNIIFLRLVKRGGNFFELKTDEEQVGHLLKWIDADKLDASEIEDEEPAPEIDFSPFKEAESEVEQV